MRSNYTGHITSAEWRWVIIIGSSLISVAFLPLLWVLIVGIADPQWTFMGVLHDYQNGSSSLQYIFQGSQGIWLAKFGHTPEPHNGVLMNMLYTTLGNLSRFITISPSVLFHIIRGGASLFMYVAFYQLAASIWSQIRARRIFFIILAIGSGFGWILSPLLEDNRFMDLTEPELFPFFGTLINIDYPLTLASLTLICAIIIVPFRPGSQDGPTVNNGGLHIFLFSLLLTLIKPIVFIPLALAFSINLGTFWYKKKQIIQPQLHWFMWLVIPALPMLAYYFAVIRYNPVAAQIWLQQNSTDTPSLFIFIMSLGIPLFLALPGIYRAIRHFEPDGDQFMIIWLLTMVILMFLPLKIHSSFAIGIMIPLTYFATRSIEDFWLNYIAKRWRITLFIGFIPILAASNFFVLTLPLRTINNPTDLAKASGILLQNDYIEAFNWLKTQTRDGDVILAAPDVSLWIPTRMNAQVVYGHPQGTIDAQLKRQKVLDWYRETNIERCQGLLQGDLSFDGNYTVHYVILGPQEKSIRETVCINRLRLVNTFGNVQVFIYP